MRICVGQPGAFVEDPLRMWHESELEDEETRNQPGLHDRLGTVARFPATNECRDVIEIGVAQVVQHRRRHDHRAFAILAHAVPNDSIEILVGKLGE